MVARRRSTPPGIDQRNGIVVSVKTGYMDDAASRIEFSKDGVAECEHSD